MKLNKNIILVIITILILVLIFFLSSNVGTKKENTDPNLLKGKHNVLISVKDYGDILLELDADNAPITVTNFINLVNDGFYNGLTFHRILEGFMVQGGAPEGTVYGGSGKTIKGEFNDNGVENNISHVRGVISMARNSVDYNSASSQFFIVHEDSLFLDNQYAAFGKVIAGMDVVDKIAKVEVIDDNGTVEKSKQPVIESIKVVDVATTSNE